MDKGKKIDYYCSPAILAATSFLLIRLLETVLLIDLIPQKISPKTIEKNPIVRKTLMIEGIFVIANFCNTYITKLTHIFKL